MWRTFDELPEYDFRRVSVALVSVNKEVFHFAADVIFSIACTSAREPGRKSKPCPRLFNKSSTVPRTKDDRDSSAVSTLSLASSILAESPKSAPPNSTTSFLPDVFSFLSFRIAISRVDKRL